MRTLTTYQDTVLTGTDRSVHSRISFKPAGGAWTDITDLEGYSWLVGFEYGGAIDNYVHDATVSLWPSRGDLSLANLMANSKLNVDNGGTYGALIDPGAQVKIEVAVIAPDALPVSGDWVLVFVGYIEAVSWESNPIKVMCRDNGALLDRFIETQAIYPNDTNTELAVESIMQQILDDVYGSSVIDLYSVNGTSGTPWNTSDSPSWIIKQYIQKKQTVQQALLALSTQIGWQFGYRFQDDTEDFELMMWDTGASTRARGTITFTGQPSATETVTLDSTTVTEGAQWSIGSTLLSTAQSLASALDAVSGASAWALDGDYAIGTMTFTGQPSALDYFTVNSVSFNEGTEFDLGSTQFDTMTNIVNVINDSATCDCTAWIHSSSTVKVRYNTKGTAGNSATFTQDLDNCTFDGNTLGSAQAGKDVRVVIEWDEPGTAGDAITFTETLTNATADGSGTLGGTVAGTGSSVARTFTASQYHSIKALSVSRADVRNACKVAWIDSNGDQQSITVTDSDSITKYGRKYCEISLEASDQIDTESEARRLANAVIDALKNGFLIHDVELPYFWPVELGDLYTFSANGVLYDTDQSIAVYGYRHNVPADGNARTSLRCQGEPRSGHKRWLRLEARDGIAGQNDDLPEYRPVISSISSGMASIEILLTDPKTIRPTFKNWARTRVYLSTSSEFTPSSDTLYKEVGKVLKLAVTGLVPGETYYAKVSFVNGDDVESDYSAEISAVTQKSATYHENEDQTSRNFIRNPNLGAYTIDGEPPDGWNDSPGAGTWDTDVTKDTTLSATGSSSVQFDYQSGSRTLKIKSDYIPMADGIPVVYDMAWRYDGTTATNSTIRAVIEQYDEDKALTGNVNLATMTLTNYTVSTWNKLFYEYEHTAIGGTDTKYIRAIVECYFDASSSGDLTMNVDRFAGAYAPVRFLANHTTGTAVATGSFVFVQLNGESYDYGYGGNHVAATGFTAPEAGNYRFYAKSTFTDLNATDITAVQIWKTGGFTYTSPFYQSDGAGAGTSTGRALLAQTISLSVGDVVKLYVYHNKGSNATLSTTLGDTYLMGEKIASY